ncbi:MAG: exo-beta-N-acetylmuramidase NamZ domain-containing protein [Planctomycetaceae bacterium]
MVKAGLDVLAQGTHGLRGRRVGLVSHAPAVDRDLRTAVEVVASLPGVRLEAVFGPEHGYHGQAQDLEGIAGDESPAGPRIVSLYDGTAASLRPTAAQLAGLDVLVVDLVDIGSRYYTFQATMKYCLEVAAPLGIPLVVLDRPNPIGGLDVEGPAIRPGCESFVGGHDIASRHGLTMGELAVLYARDLGLDPGAVDVVRCGGWTRELYADACGLPWVLPSPNMPTVDTAVVYPGQCLLEGTNLSEGRGTTRPFEICGAPWIDGAALARRLGGLGLPGVAFRPVTFRPTFQKHAGIDCGGVQLHVVDRDRFLPVRTGLAVLVEMRRQDPARFAWRTEPYEFVSDPIAIDLLFGSDRERLAIEAGADWRDIAAAWAVEERAFAERRRDALLYE